MFATARLRPEFLAVIALAATCAAAAAAPPSATVTFVEACPAAAEADQAVTAVGLRAGGLEQPEAVHVLVLVDTSASQAGEYRQQSIEAVTGLLAKARPADRFAVTAVDVSSVPLNDGFHAAEAPAIRAARLALDSRTPLGSTDFLAAIDEAAAKLAAVDAPRSIVYIGDGPALGGIDVADFARLIDELRDKGISVSSLGVGPQVNWTCLSAIASATGGMYLPLESDAAAQEAGATIGGFAVQAVAWPTDVAVSSAAADARLRLLPGRLPPLRSDRDSVVLIEGNVDAGRLDISLAGARPANLSVEIPAARKRGDNTFLRELARNARDSDGVFLPVLGREGLELARGVIRGEAETLAALSRQAEASGSHASASRLAEASLRRDPDNQDATLVRTVANRQLDAPTGDLPPPAAAANPLPTGDDTELAELDAMRRVRAQQLEQDTAVQLKEARHLLTRDPDAARELLKILQEEVKKSDDLDAGTRQRLLAQLEMRIRESIVRSREKVERDLASERRAAIGREQRRLTDELQRREQKIKTLTERYNALVEEGIRHGYAQSERYPAVINGEAVIGYDPPTRAFVQAEREVGEEIAREAPNLFANHPIPMTARVIGRTAPLVARIYDYDAENFRTKRDQERGFMDVLHLVDVAGIPFPDEPPIIYPTADRWKEITELRKKYKSVDLANPGSAEQKIYEALEEPVENFTFNETPLRDVITQIQDANGIPVQLDVKALEEASVDLDMPITQNLSGVSLRSALRRLLGNVDLAYLIKDEVLLITSKEKAAEDLVVKVYPVADLVLPVDPGSGLNPFQSGGGLGGANSVNSGFNQGGGMGGGAGMGGGMGGGAGVGFCWVAREVYGVHDPRWLVFRDWMLTDAPRWFRDLYVAHGESAAAWLRDKPLAKAGVRMSMDRAVAGRRHTFAQVGHFQVADARARVTRGTSTDIVATAATSTGGNDRPPPDDDRVGLPDSVLDATDLKATLAEYLAPTRSPGKPGDVDPRDAAMRMAQVRVSAADLGRRQQFDKAAALLSAAIACGKAEPWMYESLALAMEAAGRPRSEIERVLLSSADFATSPVELLQLANYLARFGSPAQAIRLCRQITRVDPASREAYALAMTLAARADDTEALRWACPGVLAHEWPASQRELAARAARLSKVTIDKLTAAGRVEEAAAFKKTVDEALIRDVVIELSWTGDADIDVSVEEPTGTVCTLSNPRSPAGGTLLGDTDADDPKAPASGTHRERYVAARAFPGPYKLLVRRVWGKVAADTITAEMTIHRGTDREQTLRQQIRIGADDQLLQVIVPDGRRREPLFDAQVAQDVAAQKTIGRAVLAQQLAAITDPATAASMARSRAGVDPVPGMPFFGRGAVGYQPIITTLPEGVNMYARAVVSADRRYVRITTVPLFSGVGQVTQFNFSGGAAQGTGQAAGGQVGGGAGGQVGGGVGGQVGGGVGGQVGGGAGGQVGGGVGGQVGGGVGGQVGGGVGGQVGGGVGGGVGCWVAREVYGDHDPRWMKFRGWLTTEAPSWLLHTYATHGEDFAAWLRDKPLAKSGVRLLMDRAIEPAAGK